MDLAKEGIRKAAILVASLEPAAADALLDHLGPQRARQLRDAMVALGEIDSQEQQRVIDEFFRSGPMLARKHPPAVELDGSLAEQLGFTAGKSPEPMSADARPFRFLEEAEADKLVRLLADERPQTIALVLSHLPPQQAGSVLAGIEPAGPGVDFPSLAGFPEGDPFEGVIAHRGGGRSPRPGSLHAGRGATRR